MFRRNYSSALLEEAVDQLATLPGIGRRTALRLALHLLGEPRENVEQFTGALVRLKRDIRHCPVCGMISDDGNCPVCSDTRRDRTVVCVVESLRDVLSIENTGQYSGLYHILGGIISPIDGIGPGDIEVDSLEQRVREGGVKEVILALSATMEGDTTNFYIFRRLAPYPDVKITILARGVSVGNEIEYTDELTLGRSIMNRTLFSDTFHKE